MKKGVAFVLITGVLVWIGIFTTLFYIFGRPDFPALQFLIGQHPFDDKVFYSLLVPFVIGSFGTSFVMIPIFIVGAVIAYFSKRDQ